MRSRLINNERSCNKIRGIGTPVRVLKAREGIPLSKMLGLHNKRLFWLVQLASSPCGALRRTCIQDLFFCDDRLLAFAHALLLYL